MVVFDPLGGIQMVMIESSETGLGSETDGRTR